MLLRAVAVFVTIAASVSAQPAAPLLTQPVNDFAGVVDSASRARMERQIRALQTATGDAVVVATVKTVAPFADIEELALRMFENQGRGLGGRTNDNGVLLVVAVQDRRARIEVGYGLEDPITDGFAGETIRLTAPAFREGRYGEGLAFAVSRIVERIARARNVTLSEPAAPPVQNRRSDRGTPSGIWFLLAVFFILWMMRASHPRGRRRRWGRGPWSGWNSGVGPFGGGYGGFGGGFGGFGGGGGGFGGFGGGRSGGGGASGGW
jgi:uncharacterized protein